MWDRSSCFGTRWRALNGQDLSSLASLGWFWQTENILFQSKVETADNKMIIKRVKARLEGESRHQIIFYKFPTDFSALDNMVREPAGSDPVVLVEGTLEESVRVTVRSCVFEEQHKNHI